MTDEPSVIPIIPMKPLSDGKSRLANYLSAEERADLTIGMLRRVLTAIRGADIDFFWVVGGDWRIRNLAAISTDCGWKTSGAISTTRWARPSSKSTSEAIPPSTCRAIFPF